MTQAATTVRFFTSAALRKREEVPGEAVDWLPRSITVEYDGDQPVTGVWRSRRGARRVCCKSSRYPVLRRAMGGGTRPRLSGQDCAAAGSARAALSAVAEPAAAQS